MCHHYRTREARQLGLKPEWDNEFSLRANLYQLMLPDEGFYPLAQPPVVRLDDAGQRVMVALQWGFLPSWWKPSTRTPPRAAFQRKCINARSEEVDLKPTYRDAFRRRRCLLPAVEFFERGHYFHLQDHRPFAFAGLWDRWRDADGSALETCTLLTTEANDAVAAVGHPRMPVIFASEEEYARWLAPEITERPPLDDLLQPTPAEIWNSYQAPVEPTEQRRRSRAAPRNAGGPSQGTLFDF